MSFPDKKIVVYFAGWFEVDPEDVNLVDCMTNECKLASEFLKERGNIDGLFLEDFNSANSIATDGEMEQLDLELVDEKRF